MTYFQANTDNVGANLSLSTETTDWFNLRWLGIEFRSLESSFFKKLLTQESDTRHNYGWRILEAAVQESQLSQALKTTMFSRSEPTMMVQFWLVFLRVFSQVDRFKRNMRMRSCVGTCILSLSLARIRIGTLRSPRAPLAVPSPSSQQTRHHFSCPITAPAMPLLKDSAGTPVRKGLSHKKR